MYEEKREIAISQFIELFKLDKMNMSIWWCDRVLRANQTEICEAFHVSRYQLYRICKQVDKKICKMIS